MRMGVMGGTFDPVHNGHISVAEEARTELNLKEVIFVPAGQPWLKSPISSTQHRLQMLRLALAGKPYFKVSTVDIERAGLSYTIDTIIELRAELGSEAEFFFILGWDSLAELPQWREPSRLIKMCVLVAAPRPGYPRPDLRTLEASISGITPRVVLLDKPVMDISSSVIRDRIARGLSIRHLVPESVNEYIKQHLLYTTDPSLDKNL